jgi:transposase
MMKEEEDRHLQAENQHWREQVAQRDARIAQQALLIAQLQEQVAALSQQVKELQDRQAKDSHNSSLPPSSDRFGRKRKSLRKKSEKKSGGQEGHPGSTLRFSEKPDEVIEHRVSICACCQQDLSQVQACVTLRRQVVDIPSPRLFVQEHRAEHKQCPHCQQMNVASFPPEVTAPIQYGARIGAMAVYLTQYQLLPLQRTTEVLSDVVGVQMSEATVGELIQRTASQLVGVEQQIKEALIQAPVMHQDETGMRVGGKGYWEHVSSTASLTHYQVDASRGQEALNRIGILPHFTGISIHDCWASYFLYGCEHALCLVHVLRELVFQAEEHKASWAADLKDLLLSMKEATQEARDQGKRGLEPMEVMDWERAFVRVLDEADQLTPRATAPPGSKGRIKQSAARNLLDRLRKHQKAVFCFLEDLRVEFDNNQAERDLRMIKVQQKVSGGFRSLAGAQAFSRIRGYLSTLRKQGLPLLPALQATLSGHPLLPSFEPA